jgi:hypothetical protein
MLPTIVSWILVSCLAASNGTPSAAAADDLTVPLPLGETPLADIGVYRITWQSYGREPVEMPVGWTGHFTPDSGISYTPWGRVLGRPAILLHSPWRAPAGRMWTTYRLALPPAVPVRLSFGIAMGPDVAFPDKSDGVTFWCALAADGAERQLFRVHHDKAVWKDYSFDLSAHAGKTVEVKIGVEPGPKNNAGFDYSFLGDAKIVAGDARVTPAEVLRRFTGTRAYRAVEAAGVIPLANRPGAGVIPSNILPCRNAVEASGKGWRFIYEGADCGIAYDYVPSTGTLDDITVSVDGGRPFRPAAGGGARCTVRAGAAEPEVPARGGKAVETALDGDSLHILWEYPIGGSALRIAWTFRIAGKALVIAARCDEPRVAALSLGSLGGAPLRRPVPVPYLPGGIAYLPDVGLFACRFFDWTISNASRSSDAEAVYEPRTDGTRNPLSETGYVAVSPDLGEVLPGIPHPPSKYRKALGPRILLDIWGHKDGTFRGDAENLRDLEDLGVDHLAIIQHDWQRYGYDVKLPDHIPANPRYGGDEGLAEFGRAALAAGHLWSVHENYIDLYHDAPSYDPAARVLGSDGSPTNAWFNPGTGIQSFGLKADRALGYARENSPAIHRRLSTNAAYLDVHPCVPPWHQLDHEAGRPMSAMARARVRLIGEELFGYMRETHGGPLFGEGNDHLYWAGRCDGVEAQVSGGEDHVPLLDFDLLKLHPQMANHGMGYYERWFRQGYASRWGVDVGAPRQLDQYRAQELAYGHAGFMGNILVENGPLVAREHHLVHPIARLYGESRAAEIRYEVEGRLVSASAAVAAGDTSRQRIRYESGLTLWVNWRAEPWAVEGRVLPQWGFLALGPDTEVSMDLRGGKIADFARSPEYVFADARTSFHMPYRRAKVAVEPRLRSFRHLGVGRCEATYEWIVDEALDRDYACFVHGVGIEGAGTERIVFQGDHALPAPTSRWKKGDVLIDGPHALAVPAGADSYDLVMGLFDPARGPRVRLRGPEASGERILIARLQVERRDGAVVQVRAEASPEALRAASIPEADFEAGRNPEGTWIDFGPVATDGALKVERGKGRLTLIPLERDRRFRASLDLGALLPGADPTRARIRALEARSRRDLGPATSRTEGGRLILELGTPAGAGRYEIAWE